MHDNQILAQAVTPGMKTDGFEDCEYYLPVKIPIAGLGVQYY